MSQITIKIAAFGAIERQLPAHLEILCSVNTQVFEVLAQITQDYPSVFEQLERCACAIGEDIIARQSSLDTDCTLVLLSPVAGG